MISRFPFLVFLALVNPELCILWADDPSVSKEPIATTLGELSAKVA